MTEKEEHHCHAIGCTEVVPPSMLMCRHHWYMVAKKLRDAVWRQYRRGQERDKNPSGLYVLAARQAIHYVAMSEHRMTAEQASQREAVTRKAFDIKTEEQP